MPRRCVSTLHTIRGKGGAGWRTRRVCFCPPSVFILLDVEFTSPPQTRFLISSFRALVTVAGSDVKGVRGRSERK